MNNAKSTTVQRKRKVQDNQNDEISSKCLESKDNNSEQDSTASKSSTESCGKNIESMATHNCRNDPSTSSHSSNSSCASTSRLTRGQETPLDSPPCTETSLSAPVSSPPTDRSHSPVSPPQTERSNSPGHSPPSTSRINPPADSQPLSYRGSRVLASRGPHVLVSRGPHTLVRRRRRTLPFIRRRRRTVPFIRRGPRTPPGSPPPLYRRGPRTPSPPAKDILGKSGFHFKRS